jgi:hypothetical protein
MIKSECDRCGATARVKGARVTLTQGSETAVYDRVKLPEGWWRMPVPPPVVAFDGCRELCPKCVNALALFFSGDGMVPGLLEPESLAGVKTEPEGCTCPQPVPETPPCPIHDLPPLGEPDAEPEHGTPECPFCPRPGYQLTDEHIREVHPERLPTDHVAEPEDPRPNLTARAKVLSSPACPACGNAYLRGRLAEHMETAHGA